MSNDHRETSNRYKLNREKCTIKNLYDTKLKENVKLSSQKFHSSHSLSVFILVYHLKI
jgi:hypothetical protein